MSALNQEIAGYVAKPSAPSCAGCEFTKRETEHLCDLVSCTPRYRDDGHHVIFIKEIK